MPESGFCTDSRCSTEIQRLYECHCCLRLICLNHLIEHDEIEKQTKEKFYSLTKELRRRIDSVQLSMVNRLSIIEREKQFLEREKMFVEQANHFLDGQSYSIDQMEQILEEFNQLVQTNGLKETIVKVESSSLNVTNHPFASQYLNEHISRNEFSLEILPSESKSSICLDSTEDSGEREKEIRREEMESPMCMDDHVVESTSLNQNDDSFEYNDENKKLDISLTGFRGCCPLIFDGAYGLSQSKHSIHLCSNKRRRSCSLYYHFKGKHQLTLVNARRLVEAMAKKQNPLTTKLFADHEDIIDPFYRIECPFRKGMSNLFHCHMNKSIRRVPCQSQSIVTCELKRHLRNQHHLTEDLATKFVQHYRTKNNHLSPS